MCLQDHASQSVNVERSSLSWVRWYLWHQLRPVERTNDMKLWRELTALAFTLLASVITLLTLSGKVQQWALWLTIGAFIVHMLGVFTNGDDE